MTDLLLDRILGQSDDPVLHDRLHEIAHHGRVERLMIVPADLPRRRFRAVTDHDTPCFIALPRETPLTDGAVLFLAEDRAIILRVGEQAWMAVEPAPGSALELGYLAGNLHWRVRFEEGRLLVALEGPRAAYEARLRDLAAQGRLRILDDHGH